VDEGRGADVVPHLAGDHGEDEEEGDEGPGRPVVEELQVVAPQVQQTADQGRQHHHSHRSCIRRQLSSVTVVSGDIKTERKTWFFLW
jgi:hypothetical protein